MRPIQLAAVLVLLAAPALSAAQSGERGSMRPGMSQDGSGPADGAIQGGAILPGERSGVPSAPIGARVGTPGDREVARCRQLTGVLREQCLRDVDSASGGATQAPKPPSAPPPQNPR